MPSVAQLAERVQTLITQFTDIQKTIATPKSSLTLGQDLTTIESITAAEIRELKDQQLTADVQFREAETTAQATGYKTIRQNLQEFVITFFFISYLIFTITLIIYNYTETGQLGSALLKIGGMMGVSLLCIAAIIIRYG
jgi:hypothetical protein